MTPSRHRDVRFLTLAVRRGAPVPAHVHDVHQLLHVEEGALTLDHRRSSWVVPSGGSAWLPAGRAHALEALHDARLAVLYVRARPADRYAEPGPVEVPALLTALVARLSRPVPDAARRARLERLVRDELGDLVPRSFVVPVPTEPTARRVALAIVADPADQRTLVEWAATVGASVRTLQRRFREQTGLTFQAWRRRAGLQHTMTGLAAGETVTAAAHRCGFASASAFIAAFRGELGTTPAAWQRAATTPG